MASRNEVVFSSIKRKANGKFDLALRIENVKKHFDVNIIDQDGVFGIDMPDELGLLLREFPKSQKNIVKSVQAAFQDVFPNRHLEAA